MVQNYTFIEGDLGEVLSVLHETKLFGLDLETTGLSPLDSRIILCQIGFRDKGTFVIDTSKVDITPILPYFRDPKWRVIIQRSEFERKFIQYYHNTEITNVYDTYLAEKLLATDQKVSCSLETMALKYAGMKLDKTIRTSFTEARPMGMFSAEQLQYAADDVIAMFPIMDAQEKLLKEKELEKVAELEFEVAQVVANMELVGVPILQDKWHKILEETQEEHEQSRIRLNEIFFGEGSTNAEQMGMFVKDSINLNSPKQLKAAFEGVGVHLESTNERIIGLVDHPAAKELLNYRGLQKIVSSYGSSFLDYIHPFTGRIHADFLQLGTDTGRFSCQKPNLQQMPDKFRQCVGDPNMSIIAVDYSQMELRILAELSQDPNFLKAFASGEDLHKATAATMFNIPIENVNKEQRFIAKTINFGLAYGMGANKLKDMLNAEVEPGGKMYTQFQARKLISTYKTAYKAVVDWLEAAGYGAVRKGYSETMYGRKRFFSRPTQGIDEGSFDMQMAGIRRQGANSPIQGTNADITKLAMVDIQRELKNNGFSADIIIQVHDEIVVLSRKEEATAVKMVITDAMIKASEKVLKTVPTKVDSYISDIWKKG